MGARGRSAVLGADGQIGRLLVLELIAQGRDVVAVSRKPMRDTTGGAVEFRTADATEPEQLDRALLGCSTVYSTLGLPYSASVWEARWVTLMRNVVDATLHHNARLVYLDNVYAYGLVRG